MSKWMTGIHKGEDIMHCDRGGKHWTDHNNNIFIDAQVDLSGIKTGLFKVSERLRGNLHQVWATNLIWSDALCLAERLVVGKDYLPPVANMAVRKAPVFEMFDIFCSDMHMHQLGGEITMFYGTDDSTRMENAWLEDVIRAPNKAAVVIAMSEEGVPETVQLAYKYDSSYYTVIARLKKN